MAIPLYLAMTAAETFASPLPRNMAYMACHFSSYGLGLSNIPDQLPAGALLILNDRIPVWEHDPALVAGQLSDAVSGLCCGSVLLDFQRPGNGRTADIVKAVLDTLSCPVGVSEQYAEALPCPVFVSAPPPDMRLEHQLAPWVGRELWLEAATETVRITVTQTGSTAVTIPFDAPVEPVHTDEELCCRYHIDLFPDRAVFTLSRTQPDLNALLSKAESLGVTRAVGLYQQLGNKESGPPAKPAA